MLKRIFAAIAFAALLWCHIGDALAQTKYVYGTLNLANFAYSGSMTTPFTQGSIPYIGASGLLSQDNANLFWDATNHRWGIGTTTPAAPLTIVANGLISAVPTVLLQVSDTAHGMTAASNGVSSGTATNLQTSNGGSVAYVLASGIVPWYVNHDGSMFNSGTVTFPALSTVGTIAGSICATSGGLILYESGASSCTISLRALKRDIEKLTGKSALDETMALKPVSFEFKDGYKRKRVGFVAEDVQNVDSRCSTYDGKGKLQGYDPNCMIALLTAAVQEQQREIAALKSER